MRPTIFIPNYNGAARIGRALDGLRGQSRAVDVVVADNGSADGSVELLRERYPEVKLLELGANLGFGPALNRAVAAHAEADSRRLRHEAEDYIDQKLAAFEVVLERTMATVQKGREQLQAVVEPLPTELPDEHTGLESMYESGENAVFDQDDR